MLVLFDIDGTLLEAPSHIHARAVEQSAAEVYSTTIRVPLNSPRVDGLTTPMVGRMLLQEANAWDAGRADVWREAMIRDYLALQEVMPEQRPLDGAQSALDRLVDGGIGIGLLTGNFRDVATAKLRAAGVWHEKFDLEQGAFGDDNEDRNELGRIARTRAQAAGEGHLVIVGDTLHDVACARSAQAVAVALNSQGHEPGHFDEADFVASTLDDVVTFLLDRAGTSAAP